MAYETERHEANPPRMRIRQSTRFSRRILACLKSDTRYLHGRDAFKRRLWLDAAEENALSSPPLVGRQRWVNL